MDTTNTATGPAHATGHCTKHAPHYTHEKRPVTPAEASAAAAVCGTCAVPVATHRLAPPRNTGRSNLPCNTQWEQHAVQYLRVFTQAGTAM
jgi:hypothetical protein